MERICHSELEKFASRFVSESAKKCKNKFMSFRTCFGIYRKEFSRIHTNLSFRTREVYFSLCFRIRKKYNYKFQLQSDKNNFHKIDS